MALVLLWCSKDYSLNGDALSQIRVGENVFRYLGQTLGLIPGTPQPVTLNYYGGLFGVTAEALHRVFPSLDFIQLRHLLVALTGFLCLVYSGKIAKILYNDTAQLCSIWFLFLSPRFFAASMNNSKDIPFALGMTMATFFLIKIMNAAPALRFRDFVGLGIGLFVAIGVRIGGVLFGLYAVLALVLLAIRFWQGRRDYVRRLFGALVVTGVLAFAAAIIFLPFVWHNIPLATAQSVRTFSNYYINVTMLFRGQDLPTTASPWEYLPVWIAITSPIIITLLFLGSIVLLGQKNDRRNGFILLLMTVFVPWVIVLLLHSPVYDAWRQFYFIFPAITALAGIAAAAVFGHLPNRKLKLAWVLGIGLSLSPAVVWSVRNHPLQSVYFNRLVGGLKGAFGYYETDFYGESVQIAVRKLLSLTTQHTANTDTIYVLENVPSQIQFYLQKANPKINVRHAAYFQRHDFRWDYGVFYSRGFDSVLHNKNWPPANCIDSVAVDGVMLMAIVKNPSP